MLLDTFFVVSSSSTLEKGFVTLVSQITVHTHCDVTQLGLKEWLIKYETFTAFSVKHKLTVTC